jgi:hypothetical protein
MASLVEKDRVREYSTTTGAGNVTLSGATIGYRTFASVMADGDMCCYVISSPGSSEWEVGCGTFVAATPALARTTIYSSSNSNSVVTLSSGTKLISLLGNIDRLALPQVTTDPAAPGSGNWLYTKKLAGRWVPRFVGPSGLDSAVNPSLWGNTVTMYLPGTGTTAPLFFGVSFTVTGTQAHPTIASTSQMTVMRRTTFQTNASIGGTAGFVTSAPIVLRGNTSGMGGFFFAARFGITTYVSTGQIWVGLSGSNAALGGEPDAVNDSIAMTKKSSETVWRVITRDASTTDSTTTTGRTTQASGDTNIFDFQMFCPPNGSNITVRVVDITDGTVLVDNVVKSSNLPTNTVPLYAHFEARNSAASTQTIFICKMYIESDD